MRDYPEADIVQGKDYQTGYFVNGKHVKNRDSIDTAIQEKKNDDENLFKLAQDINSSIMGVTEEDKNENENRISEAELKGRITGIEHISNFEAPPKRFCTE